MLVARLPPSKPPPCTRIAAGNGPAPSGTCRFSSSAYPPGLPYSTPCRSTGPAASTAAHATVTMTALIGSRLYHSREQLPIDAAQVVRVVIRLRPPVRRRQEEPGVDRRLRLHRVGLAVARLLRLRRAGHGIEEVEVIDERDRLDGEHGGDVLVVDR